jgi:transposase InsO family protein
MPWKVSDSMDQRMRMIVDHDSDEYTIAELSRIYGVSRRTVYKWLGRYEAAGAEGLRDQSRAPRHHPHAVPADVEEAVVAFRTRHPSFGPKKVLARLRKDHPETAWPACSTIAEILRRRGLVSDGRRRRRTPPYTEPFAHCDGPNAVWCLDHMGWFLTGDGSKCEPLTLTDAFSRYLFRCQSVPDKGRKVTQAILTAVFREYGLPDAVRSDNGSPFASRGIGGFSRLSVWLVQLGITPERIEPGQPQQNGRHERMHRTVQEATARPPRRTLRSQQGAFDAYRQEYNHERPHEALGMATPAEVYRPSGRPFPERLEAVGYPSGLVARVVQKRGEFYWHRQRVFVGEAFGGRRIGLEPMDDRYWLLYFAQHVLGVFDSRNHVVLAGKPAIEACVAVGVIDPPRGSSAALQSLLAGKLIGTKV